MCSSNIYHCIELVGPIFKMGLKGDIITIANLLFFCFFFLFQQLRLLEEENKFDRIRFGCGYVIVSLTGLRPRLNITCVFGGVNLNNWSSRVAFLTN